MERRDPWAHHTDPDAWTRSRCRGDVIAPRRPEPGEVFGIRYGAWRVVEVRPFGDADLTDRDIALMAKAPHGQRDLWRPYAVVLDLVAGPSLFPGGRRRVHLQGIDVDWRLLGERHPVCSCHGHPWPCQDADRDRVAGLQAKAMEREIARVVPGCCPACQEPVTTRQKSVTYPGENLRVPTGPEPVYHLRRGCRAEAMAYERQWIKVDPRRERVLTYPDCPGTLVVHADGSSECRRGVFDCLGHLTHDHSARSACFCADASPCPRGCPTEGHPGVRTTPRPSRIPLDRPTLPI